MTPPPVLLDCDPGIDDALALIYLAGLHTRGDIRLVGVTTTAGNTTTRRTAINAAWVLERCGVTDVPVAAGRAEPLKASLTTTPETHGEHGMGYLAPAVEQDVDTDWETLWAKVCAEHGERLLLIVTGPCTNLAAWLGSGTKPPRPSAPSPSWAGPCCIRATRRRPRSETSGSTRTPPRTSSPRPTRNCRSPSRR